MSFWTFERVAILREHWEKGRNATAIAKMLNTTKNAVIGKANRRGFVHGSRAHEVELKKYG